MRAVTLLLCLAPSATALALVSCGSGDDTAAPIPVTADASAKDASAADGASDATLSGYQGVPASTKAFLRFANWSASGAAAVDFCIAPHGSTSFQGPLLAQLYAELLEAGVPDAGPGSLSFPSASAYLMVNAGQYDARVVVAGADCSPNSAFVRDLADTRALPALAAGGAATVALVGALGGSPSLELIGLVDSQFSGFGAKYRVINAASAAPIYVSVGKGQFPNLAFGVTPVTMGDASVVDPNGYMVQPTTSAASPLNNVTMTAMDQPDGSDLAVAKVSSGTGGDLTLVVVPRTTDASTLDEIVECVDNGATAVVPGVCWVLDPM